MASGAEAGDVVEKAFNLLGEALVDGGVGEGALGVEELVDAGDEDADGVGVGVAVAEDHLELLDRPKTIWSCSTDLSPPQRPEDSPT
jgi:hypothetical protein